MQITWRHSHMYMVWFFRMQFPLRKYVKLCICLFHTVTMQGLHPHLVTPHPGHARIIFQHKAGRSPCGGFKHLRTEHLQDIVAIVHVSFRCGIFKSILSPLPIILSIFRSEHGLVHFNVRCILNGSSTGCILPVVVRKLRGQSPYFVSELYVQTSHFAGNLDLQCYKSHSNAMTKACAPFALRKFGSLAAREKQFTEVQTLKHSSPTARNAIFHIGIN